MKSELVISGVTFSGFAQQLPVIPGLQVLAFFGTGGDGVNTNRVPGGPTFSNYGSAPTFSTNFMTVNTGLSTTNAAINTGLQESAAVATAGWTMFCVARGRAVGNSALMSIGQTGPTQMIMYNANAQVSGHPSILLTAQTGGPTVDQTIDLGATNYVTNWKFMALTYLGSPGQYVLYDITDNLSATSTTTYTVTGATSNYFYFGYSFTSGADYGYLADIAFGGITTTKASLSLLQSIRTSALGLLGNRGIAGF